MQCQPTWAAREKGIVGRWEAGLAWVPLLGLSEEDVSPRKAKELGLGLLDVFGGHPSPVPSGPMSHKPSCCSRWDKGETET